MHVKFVTLSTVKQSSFWRQGLMHVTARGKKFLTCRSQLTIHRICMSVSLFYHIQRQNIGAAHIPEALPPVQRYSYTTTSQGGTAQTPTSGHLAKKLVDFSIWASDRESVQEFKPLASDSWENLAFRMNITARLRPFPSILPHYPKL